MRLYQCDKCGLMSGGCRYMHKPEGWKEVRMDVSGYSGTWLDVCPKCAKELGMSNKKTYERPSDKLVNAIYDMIEETLEEA